MSWHGAFHGVEAFKEEEAPAPEQGFRRTPRTATGGPSGRVIMGVPAGARTVTREDFLNG